MKYASIKQHREIFSVSRQCAVLGVSRSGYYEWLGRPESTRRREEQRLGAAVFKRVVASSLKILNYHLLKVGGFAQLGADD